MKTIIALAAALTVGAAYAQTSGTGHTHMFEFSSSTVEKGVLGFKQTKTPGNRSENTSEWNLGVNYAYSIPAMPAIQLGGRLNYLKDNSSSTDTENYGAAILAYWNFRDGNGALDLSNSLFAKVLVGMSWINRYGSSANNEELTNAEIALGKRMSLNRWGAAHLVYSPEIAWTTLNSTTNASTGYAQGLELRFLQFSVFF